MYRLTPRVTAGLVAGLLLLTAWLPYAGTRHFDHVHDDHDFRGPASLVADARADWSLLWQADVFGTYEKPTGHSGFWRPLVLTTFRIEHWLTNGRQGPFVWLGHVITILLHGLATLALWRLLLALDLGELPAFTAALLFAAHPVHAEPVAWLSGRTDVMPAALAWGATTLLLRRRSAALAVVMFAAALLCKETAALLVGLAVPLVRGSGRSWRAALGPPVVALALVGGLRLLLFEGGMDPAAYTGPEATGVRWLTWLSIVPDVVRLTIWPGPATPIHPVAAVTSAADVRVLAGAVVILLLTGLGWHAWRKGRGPLVLAWGLLLGSLLVLAPWVRFPLGYAEIAAPLYERHLYAAAATIGIIAAWALRAVSGRAPTLVLVSALLAAALLIPIAAARTRVWSSDVAFARAALQRLPRSPSFLNHLGVALLPRATEDPAAAQEALDAFSRALAHDPNDPLPRLNRFILLAMLERDDAVVAARELLQRHPEDPAALDNVARWHMNHGRWSEAAALLERELATGRALPGAPQALAICHQALADAPPQETR